MERMGRVRLRVPQGAKPSGESSSQERRIAAHRADSAGGEVHAGGPFRVLLCSASRLPGGPLVRVELRVQVRGPAGIPVPEYRHAGEELWNTLRWSGTQRDHGLPPGRVHGESRLQVDG